jgi:hypothetical protein
LVPNILLSTLLSNTLSLCSSLNVRDQVSHPYKTTGKNSFVCHMHICRSYNVPELLFINRLTYGLTDIFPTTMNRKCY